MIDIDKVIKVLKVTNPNGFINESHFQVQFGFALKNVYPDSDITFEYAIDKKRIDLICENDHETIGIEFKYYTKKDEIVLCNGLKVALKDQNTKDLHRIGFWKDVSKLESLKAKDSIDYGFCLFLSNDLKVFNDTKNGDHDFSIANGIRPGKHVLQHDNKKANLQVELIKDNYELENKEYNNKFNLLILKV